MGTVHSLIDRLPDTGVRVAETFDGLEFQFLSVARSATIGLDDTPVPVELLVQFPQSA